MLPLVIRHRAAGAVARLPLACTATRALHISPYARRPAEPPLPGPTLAQRLGDNPQALAGLALGGGVLSTLSGYYVWNAESQILGLFVLFAGTVYLQGGSAIGKFLDDTAEAIQKEQNALEDAQIAATKVVKDAHQKQATVFGDIQAVFEGQMGLMKTIVETQNSKLKHELRNKTVKQLDHLVMAQANAKARFERELVERATASVRKVFASPKAAKIKAKALDNALAVLKDPKAQPKDQVTALFQKYFALVKKKADKVKGKEVPVSAKAAAAGIEAAKAAARRDGLEALTISAPAKIRM